MMSDSDSNATTPTGNGKEFSLGRVMMTVIPLAIVAVAVWAFSKNLPNSAQQELETNQLSRLLGERIHGPAEPVEFIDFVDNDNDLLADPPAEDQCVTPDTLYFSYVASDSADEDRATWAPFVAALAEATETPAEYRHFASVNEQLAALATNQLHVTAVNTGAVPSAVRLTGFIPVSTRGQDDEFGYTMKLLVATDSDLQKLSDFSGTNKRKITFVRPNSNSGFKAALVLLLGENILPERDYDYGFSMGHDTSVKELVAGKTDAAPVASDLLDRMVADGEVDPQAFRVLYESERFPPVSLGYVYNLAPELRNTIGKLLIEFEWEGTPLLDAYGASGATEFVAVNYKDDWANIRRIDEAIEQARKNR